MGNQSIANDALQYIGHSYLFGGSPGKNGTQPWDCSSFVNYVIGVDLGGDIPGIAAGKYDGTSHGPNTTAWLSWSGANTIPRSSVSAGDLLIWPDHMGIATSNSQMVSALDPKLGTKVTGIEGAASGKLICRTYSGTVGSPKPSSASSPGFDWANPVGSIESIVAYDVGQAAGTATSDLGKMAINGIAHLFGLNSFKDLAIRAGLVILGFILIYHGLKTAFSDMPSLSTRTKSSQSSDTTGESEVTDISSIRQRRIGNGATE